MAQPTPLPVPLEQTREHVIQQLCEHFAYDNLTADALEERLDRAHQAATLDDLRSLVCPECGHTQKSYWMPKGKDVQAILNDAFLELEVPKSWKRRRAQAD